MSNCDNKVYSKRTLRHNARKRTREIVERIINDSLSESEYESVVVEPISIRHGSYACEPAQGAGQVTLEAREEVAAAACVRSQDDVSVDVFQDDYMPEAADLHADGNNDICDDLEYAAGPSDLLDRDQSSIESSQIIAEWDDTSVLELVDIMDSDNYRLSTDSDGSDDDQLQDSNRSIKNQLQEWAVNSNIPLVHVSGLLKILHASVPGLPKDARTLLSTHCKDFDVKEIAGGKYFHFGIANNLNSQVAKIPHLLILNEHGEGSILLQIFVDGLPISKSTPTQFWPILGRIHQPESKATSVPFIIGLFLGERKPSDPNAFLSDFVEEMKEIEVHGVLLDGNKRVQVSISNFVCDTPARSFIKCTKGHGGYYGCDKCAQRGVYFEHRVTFPEVGAERRTDDSFLNQENKEHHNDTSILSELHVGMVSQFPIDYMHNVCLGIVRKLILVWMRGPLRTRIGWGNVNAISKSLLELKAFIPCEFSRKGRSLDEIDRWKATEFRTFLLYTGVVALKGILSDESYGHFSLLHVAMTILSSPSLSLQYAKYAQELLIVFSKNFGDMFGKEMIIYNVHAIIHLADDVQQFGPVDNFSGFPFENYLQVLKRMLRKPSQPLQQVIRRISEKMEAGSNTCSQQAKEGTTYKHKHVSGPLPPILNQQVCSQFKTIILEEFTVSIKRSADSVVLIGDDISQVQNIIMIGAQSYVVYKMYMSSSSFFQYPLESSKIGIVYVENLGTRLKLKPVTAIVNKVVLLPFKKGYVALPLNHKKNYM